MDEGESDDLAEGFEPLLSGDSSSVDVSAHIWEDIMYKVDRVHEQQKETSESRETGKERRKEILDKLDSIDEKDNEIERLKAERDDLKEEVQKLTEQLESYQRDVPAPAYAVILVGIGLLFYSSLSAVRVIFPLFALGMVIIGAVAIYESKFKMNRTR